MGLIDTDTFVRSVVESGFGVDFINRVTGLLMDTPTIEPTIDKDYLVSLIQEAVYDGESCKKLLDLVDKPQGEWELSAFQNDADVANGNYAFICSNCKHTDIHALTQTVPYCWWCGARMNK